MSRHLTLADARELRPRALEYVSDELDFHNRIHFNDVEGYLLAMFPRLRAKNVFVNKAEALVAGYYHDALFHEPIEEGGSRERRSADVMVRDLTEEGIYPQSIERVEGAILATAYDIRPKNNLEIAVSLADVGNIAHSEREFLKCYLRVVRETVRFKDQPFEVTFSEHARETIKFLSGLILPLPDFIDRDGNAVQLYDGDEYRSRISLLGELPLSEIIAKAGFKIASIPFSWEKELAA